MRLTPSYYPCQSRSGDRYPYFICSARHAKRNDCLQRATLIDEVEAKIEELYDKISFTPEFKRLMREWLLSEIDKLAETSKSELERLKAQKDKLERERKKLLQAHYADAIPLHLLKEEQERISKSLNKIVGQMAAYTDEYSQTIVNLDDALTLLEDCGKAYRLASDSERRCFNQAIFKRILVYEDLKLDAEYAEPFDALLDSRVFMLKHESEKYSDTENAGQEKSPAQFSLSDLICAHKPQTSTFFNGAGLSKDILVRIRIPYPNKFIRMALVCRTRIFRHSIGMETGNANSFADAHLYGEDVKMVRRHKLHCRLLTPTEQDEAVAKYKTGMTMTDVANLYGCHYTTIGRLLRQRGIGIR